MKRIIILLVTLVFILSCSTSSKTTIQETNVEFKPEIPLEVLNNKGIAAINSNYKRNYFRLMPYLFFNENDVFNGIKGDFYNIKNDKLLNFNIMPGYWREYGKYKNSLVVLIAMSDTSNPILKKTPITVESSKHVIFVKADLKNSEINRKQQRVLFVKKLELKNDSDILNKMIDDVITVTINGQNYKFLNPELELN